jgi:hypothetical protein
MLSVWISKRTVYDCWLRLQAKDIETTSFFQEFLFCLISKFFKDAAVYIKNTIPLVSKFIVFVRVAKMD